MTRTAYTAMCNRIQWFKEIFSGSTVRDWADIGKYRKGVKLVMEVRVRLGGEEGGFDLVGQDSQH